MMDNLQLAFDSDAVTDHHRMQLVDHCAQLLRSCSQSFATLNASKACEQCQRDVFHRNLHLLCGVIYQRVASGFYSSALEHHHLHLLENDVHACGVARNQRVGLVLCQLQQLGVDAELVVEIRFKSLN